MCIERQKALLATLLSLMILPSLARGLPPPQPPEVGTQPAYLDAPKGHVTKNYDPKEFSPSNEGAVNEGGGSANTNGMNNGLSPNSSGSGSNSARASDTFGIPFGSSGKDTGSGNVQQEK